MEDILPGSEEGRAWLEVRLRLSWVLRLLHYSGESSFRDIGGLKRVFSIRDVWLYLRSLSKVLALVEKSRVALVAGLRSEL